MMLNEIINFAKWILGTGLIVSTVIVTLVIVSFGVRMIWAKAHDDVIEKNSASKNWEVLLRTGSYLITLFVGLGILGATTKLIDDFLGWTDDDASSFFLVLLGYSCLWIYLYDSRFGKWLRHPAKPDLKSNDNKNQDAA